MSFYSSGNNSPEGTMLSPSPSIKSEIGYFYESNGSSDGSSPSPTRFKQQSMGTQPIKVVHQACDDHLHQREDRTAIAFIVDGVAAMNKEMLRLHNRMDTLESSYKRFTSPLPSPLFRPRSFIQPQPLRSLSSSSSEKLSLHTKSPVTTTRDVPAQVTCKIAEQELDKTLWCVVPAGGAGTRLWPLSRENYPKFLLDLTGSGRTLLQATWDRLLPLCGPDQVLIVTGQAHSESVLDQLPQLKNSNLLAEPSPKESMAAIGLAAAVLMKRNPEAIIGSFAADHVISGRDAFESAVREAVAVAKLGFVVTIGIAPSHPSTGFGYIKLGNGLEIPSAPNARLVTEFNEKPDAKTASSYLANGDYQWNGGMFVVQASKLMALLETTVPELYKGIMEIASVWDQRDGKREQRLAEIWPTLPKIAIDHAIAEPAAKVGKVAVIPATFGWDDVGDYASLSDLIPAENGVARVLGDDNLVVTSSQAGGLIVPASGRMVACLGVDDAVVIDTPDALLVTTRARSQDVKKLVAQCKKQYPQLC